MPRPLDLDLRSMPSSWVTPWPRPKDCCAQSALKMRPSFSRSIHWPVRQRSRLFRSSKRSTPTRPSMHRSRRSSTAWRAGWEAATPGQRPARRNRDLNSGRHQIPLTALSSGIELHRCGASALDARHGGVVARLEENLCRYARRGDLERVAAGQHLIAVDAVRITDIAVTDRAADGVGVAPAREPADAFAIAIDGLASQQHDGRIGGESREQPWERL